MNVKELTIGLIGPLPPPSGGMANQTRQLAELLQKESACVQLVQVNAPYRPSWIRHVRGIRAIFRFVPYMINLWRAAGRVDLFHIMANSGWSWHLYAAPSVWVAKARGVPVVINYRGGEADRFFEKSHRSFGFTLKRANRIIVPSSYLQSVFAKWGYATTVVPNIIDLSRFYQRDREGGLSGRRANFPHVLVARNLEPIYDNATALRAFQIIKKEFHGATMTIAGSGPEREALQRLTAELGLAESVSFSGQVGNAEMPHMYRSADVVVNPSLADNMPISILEALASGVPVVSTNVGGVPYLLRDGTTGLLVPPKDFNLMAHAIRRLVVDKDLKDRLTSEGARYVQRFDWRHVRHELFSVYHELFDADRRRALSDRSV